MNKAEIKKAICEQAKKEYNTLCEVRKELDKGGIYVIEVNGNVIYVGESANLLKRFIAHKLNTEMGLPEHKYDVFRDLLKMGYDVRCEVVEQFTEMDNTKENRLFSEAVWINRLSPILNVQIPHLDNPTRYNVNVRAKSLTAQDIIREVIDAHYWGSKF